MLDRSPGAADALALGLRGAGHTLARVLGKAKGGFALVQERFVARSLGGGAQQRFVYPVGAPGVGGDLPGQLFHQPVELIVGADVVEVAPPFDPSGNTALVAATMMYELLCILAETTVAKD